MTSPFKRFFGGIMIGIFLSIPFLQGQGESFGQKFFHKIQVMPLAASDAFLAACVAFLGMTCACVGAVATRKARSLVSPPTGEKPGQRRSRHQGYNLWR